MNKFILIFLSSLALFGYENGLDAYKSKDYKKAYELYTKEAKAGNTISLNMI